MIRQIDFAILDRIQQDMRCDFLDAIMPYITYIAEGGVVWIILGVILLIPRDKRRCGAAMLGGMGVGVLLLNNTILKNLVARPRPCWLNPSVDLLIAMPTDYSFPSGHTTASFIAATVLLRYDKRLGIPAMIAAFGVGFSRMYLYVHFPSDVLCGALLGVGVGLISVFVTEKAFDSIARRKEGTHAGTLDRQSRCRTRHEP